MNIFRLLGALCICLLSFSANASMVTGGLVANSSDYSTLTTAWDPGTDTLRAATGNPAPGGATWSIMGAGLADLGYDTHGANLTTSMIDLPGLSGLVTMVQIEYLIDYSLDLWASVSDFTNLGQVADGGTGLGGTNANGGNLGDIRIGAIYIDGSSSLGDELAHAYNPCNETLCGAGGNNGGDLHFDNSNSWFISDVDGNGTSVGSGTYDLLTVLIHELGHSLGMGHSAVVGSVMEPVYAGIRTALHADDIAGIQAIYGGATTPVPLPGALLLFLSGLSAFGLYGRKRNVA